MYHHGLRETNWIELNWMDEFLYVYLAHMLNN